MTHGTALWEPRPAIEAYLSRVPMGYCVGCGTDKDVVRRVCVTCREDIAARLFPAWGDRAACREKDPGPFFTEVFSDAKTNPLSSHSVRVAKSICSTCPVRRECLEAGMKESTGIWGGTLPRERLSQYASPDELLEQMDKQALANGLRGVA